MPLTLSRSLITIILPGIVASASWFVFLLLEFPKVDEWYQHHEFGFNAFCFSIVVALGSVFEGFGNYLEKKWDQRKAEDDPPEKSPSGTKISGSGESSWVDESWHKYLSCKFNGEPVGYRYLSRKVTALYFEMGMLFALPIGFSGVIGILVEVDYCSTVAAATLGALIIMSVFWFWKTSRDTHWVICETRYHLMKDLDKCGATARSGQGQE